jgi:hypothetical protein
MTVQSPPFDLDDVERYIKQESSRDKDLYRNRDRDWPEEEGGRPSGDGASTTRFGKKDMSQILCFKVSEIPYACLCIVGLGFALTRNPFSFSQCGQRGHFANVSNFWVDLALLRKRELREMELING